ncbi:MAG: TfuA-like protein [Deltaproteobacteria bacterium]
MSDLVVFSGPSLSPSEARRLAPCLALPPAARGDVLRALARRPRVIVLLDGRFEQVPSVWPRELLAALDAGVTVFGAASLGALRAVELAPFGMIGVGQIFRAYRDGQLIDDAEVALLHAGAEHDHRPLTVPLVQARATASAALAAGALHRPEALALVRAAERLFYQERRWPQLIADASRRWSSGARERFAAFLRGGPPDPKREDALECLRVARLFFESGARGPSARLRPPSSWLRRARPLRSPSAAKQGPQGSLEEAGLRRLLLAGWARSQGLSASPSELEAAERNWLQSLGSTTKGRERQLRRLGMDDGEARELVETLALERLALEHAARLLPDGPSAAEAGANERARRGLSPRRRPPGT